MAGNMIDNEDRLHYKDELGTDQVAVKKAVDAPANKEVKFQDFLLKTEILRAIIDCGFEHPTEVQSECIPHAVLGMDVLCQARSGTGKTTVFVLATLQQLEIVNSSKVSVLVLCKHQRAKTIFEEYKRFSKYMTIKIGLITGHVNIVKQKQILDENCPQVVIGTIGRILQLVNMKKLNLRSLKHFVLDDCDNVLGTTYLLRDVQEILSKTNGDKQVMMFSDTLMEEMRPVCKQFMQNVGLVEYSNKVTTVS